MGMEQKMVLQLYYIGIVIVIMGSLIIFMKSNVGNESFEREFLAHDFGMLQSSAMVVNSGLNVEFDLEDRAGIYSFEELKDCEVKFFQGAFDGSEKNSYFCFYDQDKQMNIVDAKFGDVKKVSVLIERDNVFFDAEV